MFALREAAPEPSKRSSVPFSGRNFLSIMVCSSPARKRASSGTMPFSCGLLEKTVERDGIIRVGNIVWEIDRKPIHRAVSGVWQCNGRLPTTVVALLANVLIFRVRTVVVGGRMHSRTGVRGIPPALRKRLGIIHVPRIGSRTTAHRACADNRRSTPQNWTAKIQARLAAAF